MSSVGILFQHPSMDPREITVELGMEPTVMARSGDTVVTPRGTKSGSHHKWSFWSYFDEDISGDINPQVNQLLQKIGGHRDFINGIIADGGLVTLIIRSEANSYMQCQFEPTALTLLSSMSVALGFEVFPV